MRKIEIGSTVYDYTNQRPVTVIDVFDDDNYVVEYDDEMDSLIYHISKKDLKRPRLTGIEKISLEAEREQREQEYVQILVNNFMTYLRELDEVV